MIGVGNAYKSHMGTNIRILQAWEIIPTLKLRKSKPCEKIQVATTHWSGISIALSTRYLQKQISKIWP
jgi:hypothetical protein